MDIEIIKYESKFKDDLINLLRLNTPLFFATEEEKDFVNYLEEHIDLYYVVLYKKHIVGCGGINFDKNEAKLSWDIIHPDYHKKGLGSKLLEHRINTIRSINSSYKISVRSSQFAYKFYEKHQFTLIEVKKDYWAKGIDMYKLIADF